MHTLPYKLEKRYRLAGYDYSSPGDYFVTICSYKMRCLFGRVLDESVNLSKIGKKIKNVWSKIPKRFSNVKLDKWEIMPNHVHGIITIIRRNMINHVPTKQRNKNYPINHVPTKTMKKTKSTKQMVKNNPMLTKYLTLGGVIRWFKAKSTCEIHKVDLQKGPIWQSRFYDHIIRNDEELYRIREYISLNPSNWEADRNNPRNLKWEKSSVS
jgi:putative transposase